MSGHSWLLLCLDEASDAEVQTFADELDNILDGTRFDPASTKLKLYCKDAYQWAKWASALHIALDMEGCVDSASPFGCSVEDSICDALKIVCATGSYRQPSTM
jgi:hypothetical protein